jgi:CHAT domain-containing protein
MGVALAPFAPLSAASPGDRPSLQDMFRIGDAKGALCQLQATRADASFRGMFDRAYSIVCRDASAPVGRVYALRNGADDPLARLATLRAANAICPATAAPARIEDLGAVEQSDCRMAAADVGYRVYATNRGRTTYVAEGLTGYDSALRLALRTVVADRAVPGTIEAATTDVGDPAAFARVQAGSLDLDQALAEGYRRNNSGSYAEAAEFFNALLARAEHDGTPLDQQQLGEYVVNRALQLSNLGQFAEADALFARAALIPTADPVQLRLRRNFQAMHLVNQKKLAAATTELGTPLAAIGRAGGTIDTPTIDPSAAAEINAGAPLVRQLGSTESLSLTPAEKAGILDAQATQLRGTVKRLEGDLPGARLLLDQGLAQLLAIREGRVSSIIRLRAQTMGELAAIDEAEGKFASAEGQLRRAVALLQSEYPGSAAVHASKARLAGYLARRGETQASLDLFGEVVSTMTGSGGTTTGFENLLAPYFALLAQEIPQRPALVTDFFRASQTLVRPGVADTQAVLARELSGGSDEAARLFRQSVNLTRDIERDRIDYARLAAIPDASADEQAKMAALREALKALEADQVATQARLSAFPRYRALSTDAMTLADLQAALKPDEAYLKLAIVGNAVYGILATPTGATAYRAPISATALDRNVSALRDTISVEENGQVLTYPFDVKLARALYVDLVEPIRPRLAGVRHLVFEPGGGMLRLPLNLLVAEQAGVDAYLGRVARPNADEFDFTGIAWLGKSLQVSTSVSARAFRDVRKSPPSAAKGQYLGLGQNAPVSPIVHLASTRGALTEGAIDCEWPLAAWDRPIKATELRAAQSIIGANASAIVTGAAFSDTAIKARADIADYRILHFATHGLVTAPRPECPARPALITSFGGATSDGLLTFKEIYDLRLDADLIILSACDTAGKATVAATREAGITSGGGEALDGLVRAFIGAGGRSVIASHWPAPDDYGATERLIGKLFSSPPGTTVAQALQSGQRELMAHAETSHPYYWADFVVIGDGDQPVLPTR